MFYSDQTSEQVQKIVKFSCAVMTDKCQLFFSGQRFGPGYEKNCQSFIVINIMTLETEKMSNVLQ